MNARYRMAEPRRRYELRIVRDALIMLLALVAFLVAATTGYAAGDRHSRVIALEGVCQADEDLFVFTVTSSRRGTIEITWQQDFHDVFDTIDLRRGTTTFYVGQPDQGSVTLFARYVRHHRIQAEAELSEAPC